MILFENESLIAIDKRANTHSIVLSEKDSDSDASESNEQSAVTELLELRPKLYDVHENKNECGLLHRLDYGTSGVLAFAKTTAAYEFYRKIWKGRDIEKYYVAITNDDLPFEAPFQVETPIGHSSKSAKRMVAVKNDGDLRKIRSQAQPAITIIHENGLVPGRKDTYLVRVQIQTGVRHQIRVHLASLGAPLFGDTLYQGKESSRLWLHSEKLVLPDFEKSESKIEILSPFSSKRLFQELG